MNTLGNKIRIFRKLKGLSQLEIELEIGLSTGTLSRIESNETNPTKETLFKIASFLGLNNLELQYLIGNIAQSATQIEIDLAREAVEDYYSTPGVLSYMVDERSRLIDISDSFLKLLGKDTTNKSEYLMRFYHDIIFDRSIGIRDYLDKKAFREVVLNTFRRTYNEMYFMEGDPVFDSFMRIINADKEMAEIWELAKNEHNKISFRENSGRTVYFNFKGVKVKTVYSVEPLWGNHRFMILHYDTPKILTKLFRTLGII